MLAAANGKTRFVEILLASGADPTIKDKEGKTAHTWAASRGRTDVARLLLLGSRGAKEKTAKAGS
jgi:ankyrin repeat protein